MVSIAETGRRIAHRLPMLGRESERAQSEAISKPTRVFRKELNHLTNRHDRTSEYLIMAECPTGNFTSPLYPSSLGEMPRSEAFGSLDLKGRQGEFYAWEDKKKLPAIGIVQDAIHPNVLDPHTVYVERTVFDNDGENPIGTFWLFRATRKADTELSYVNPVARQNYETGDFGAAELDPQANSIFKRKEPTTQLLEVY